MRYDIINLQQQSSHPPIDPLNTDKDRYEGDDDKDDLDVALQWRIEILAN
jgi:hypothetical protein